MSKKAVVKKKVGKKGDSKKKQVEEIPTAEQEQQADDLQEEQQQEEQQQQPEPQASAADDDIDQLGKKLAGVEVEGKVDDEIDQLGKKMESVDVQQPEEESEEVAPVRVGGLHPDDSTATITREGRHIYVAAKSFAELGLRKELLKAIADMKFSTPSKIQAEALPAVLADGWPHFVGQAHHGSGKTATFALAILSRVDPNKPTPQAIVVCPTRELVRQVGDVISELGKYLSPDLVYYAVAGCPDEKVTRPVVVGTPGQILKKIHRRHLDKGGVLVLVADEADHMVSREGFGDDVTRLKKMLPRVCQVLLFSATFTDEVHNLVNKLVENPTKITINRADLTLDLVKQFFVDCGSEENRFNVLTQLFGAMTIAQSIIFVQQISTAKDLANRFRDGGYSVALLHGALPPDERDRVMSDFRKGEAPVLVTTNVLSRGIDVLAVQMVINYDIPLTARKQPDPETYMHRIGRSGRFGRRGIAINFVYDSSSKEDMDQIAKYYDCTVNELPSDLSQAEGVFEKFLKGGK